MYVDFVPGTHSELTVPMLAGEQLCGVLSIESPIPNNFTEHDERLMRELADFAVVALQNANSTRKLKLKHSTLNCYMRQGRS